MITHRYEALITKQILPMGTIGYIYIYIYIYIEQYGELTY